MMSECRINILSIYIRFTWSLVFSGGGLSIKLLKRTAKFSTTEKCAILGSSLHHNIQLMIPKKSSIFMEQTNREREQSKGIDHYEYYGNREKIHYPTKEFA